MATRLNTLPSHERIKSRKLFDKLFESGHVIKQFPFRLIWLTGNFQERNPVKIAVSVPKRSMKKAVHRNRMKRLMREAYRINKLPLIEMAKHQQKSFTLMFIAHVSSPLEYNETQEKIILLLQRLIALHEKPVQ